MPANINGLPGSHLSGAHESRQVTPVHNEPTSKQRETGKTSTSDTVSLTESARQLQALEAQVNSQPVVDTQRVEAARQSIDRGTYQVQPDVISQKLLQFEAMMPAA